MSWIDLIIFAILVITGIISYFRGFYKELYKLIIIILSILLALIFKDYVYDAFISKINLTQILPFNFPQNISELIMSIIGPSLSLALIFTISMIFLKIIRFILVELNVIPIDDLRYRYLGSILGILRSLVVFSIIAFLLSFTTFLPNVNIYNDSFILKSLLKLNVPLKNMSENIHDIYTRFQNLQKQLKDFKDNPSPENIDEAVDLFKDMRETGMLTDEVIVSSSKIIMDEVKKDNSSNIDLSDIEINEFKDQLQNNDYYPVIKELFDEEVLTPELIESIAKENNIKGLNSDNIEELFD